MRGIFTSVSNLNLFTEHQSAWEQSCAIQWNGASPFEFDEKLMETETKTWLEYPNEAKAIVEQILESEES